MNRSMMGNYVFHLSVAIALWIACSHQLIAAPDQATAPVCSLQGRWQSSDRSRSMEFFRVGSVWYGQLDTTANAGSPGEVYLQGFVGPAADGTYAGRLLTVSDPNLPSGKGVPATLSCRNQDEIVVSTSNSATTWRRFVKASEPVPTAQPKKGKKPM